MKKVFLFFGVILSALVTTADVSVFDGDGRYVLDVHLSPQATPALLTAAREYTNYVAKLSGVVPQVLMADEAPVGRKVVRLVADSSAEESWKIVEDDGNLVISGGGRRGTLYGVYHFLEDELGIHWFSPGTEFLPSLNRFVFKGKRFGRPRMRYRDIYFVTGPQAMEFLARNRMNTSAAAYGGQMVYGAPRDNHTLYACLGGKDKICALFAEHPDWFPLIEGRRYLDVLYANSHSRSQLCLTNPDLRRSWVEALRGHIRNDIEKAKRLGLAPPMFYAIDQNDCYDGFCKCPSCLAIVEREGGNSGLLLDFVNYVAAELETEAPSVTFQMMAYGSTEKPPRLMSPRHNVGIRLCDSTSDVLRPWTNPVNARHYDNLLGWSKVCDKIAMWDYQITFGAPTCIGYPTPTIGTFAADLRTLAEHGGDGVFFEHEDPIGGDMRDLKVWMEMKLAEDPSLDPKGLLRTFTDGYYGPAGATIRDYLMLLENAGKKADARVGWMPQPASYSFIDAAVVERALSLFADAEALVASDEEKLARVRHARLSLDKLRILRGDASAIAGYRETWERERNLRKPCRDDGYSKGVTRFLQTVEKIRSLPTPKAFADLPKDSLFLFNAGRGKHSVLVLDDASSPAGEAIRFIYSGIVRKNPEAAEKYKFPLRSTISPLFGSDAGEFVADNTPKNLPKGYHWYRLAKDVKLNQKSVLFLFSRYSIALEGVVSDNYQLGQLYEVWASIRVRGSDCIKSGHAEMDNEFYLDQIAVVRTMSNAQ